MSFRNLAAGVIKTGYQFQWLATRLIATGDSIGSQFRMTQTASKTQDGVKGMEISGRVNDAVALPGASGAVIGLAVDAYLKGTTGNIGADVRALNVELVTDDAATRTVAGDVVGLRMRAAFSGTITGNMTAFKVEKAEAQTNSKQWEYVLELTGDNGLVWSSGYTTEPNAGTANGAFKVRINGVDLWVQTYSSAPVV